jgi:hypothetical protein
MTAVTIADHRLKTDQILLPNLLPFFLRQGIVLSRLFNEKFGGKDVRLGIKKNTIPRLSVSACSACLLIIGLKTLGHIVVNDKAHIGLVNAHAEGIGGNHDPATVVDKVLLILMALTV